MEIIYQKTKTLVTRDNGRSSDAISPNFIYGCLGGCMSSYCYVGRYNHDKVYINQNVVDIFDSISGWVDKKPWPKITNWQHVLDYFSFAKARAKSTFATKYPTMFVDKDYDLVRAKHRIRVSLMPQIYSDVLEPHTDTIEERIASIPKLQEKMEVHINFSPIIYTDGWLDEYRKLFEQLKAANIDVKCECIFLTHNLHQHERNSPEVQSLLWRPDIQEAKDSQYAPDNIRYQWLLKKQMVSDFTGLYAEYFDPTNIRYIF